MRTLAIIALCGLGAPLQAPYGPYPTRYTLTERGLEGG
jgi:hypothetical protein